MSQGARRTTATRTEREVDTAARILERDFFQSVVPRAVTFRARLSSAICALFVIARFDTTNSATVKGEKLFVSDVLVALLVVDPVSGVIMVWDIMETILVCIGAKYHLLLTPERKE